MGRYTIGIDFGTLSVRAVVFDIDNNTQIASSMYSYKYNMYDYFEERGIQLPANFALQHPKDYLDGFYSVIADVLDKSGINPAYVLAIGTDFTSCSVVPIGDEKMPLCFDERFVNTPLAFVHLWKNHSAQPYADKLYTIAKEVAPKWLKNNGGKISGEWFLPRVMHIREEAEEVYQSAYKFLEIGDWFTLFLTGNEVASKCNAQYKAIYDIPTELVDALGDKYRDLGSKLCNNYGYAGEFVGFLKEGLCNKFGFPIETKVCIGMIDAHAFIPACRVSKSGTLLMIMGTSTAHVVMSDTDMQPVACGTLKAQVDGLYCYEAAQTCVGDHFEWYMENALPHKYVIEANGKGISTFELINQKAAQLSVGESGLIALDWWNGYRTDYMDFDLSGAMIGFNLRTKPEEVYRALVEATAFGTRRIIEQFEENGVKIECIIASGGIAVKNPFAIQLYADICGRPFNVCDAPQAGAIGSAILATMSVEGTSILQAGERHGMESTFSYQPVLKNTQKYDKLYKKYLTIYRYFGDENREFMRK